MEEVTLYMSHERLSDLMKAIADYGYIDGYFKTDMGLALKLAKMFGLKLYTQYKVVVI